MKTTASIYTVKKAVESVNQKHGYKIEFKRLDQSGNFVIFTLKSKSGIPGARVNPDGRNLSAASWHAHGYIIDKIFEIEPDSILYSRGEKFTSKTWVWKDTNIGSWMQPCYISETSIL